MTAWDSSTRYCASLVALLVLILGTADARAEPEGVKANWTIMVYMNGDNNLEPDALLNFAQMAEVGSDEHVNVLVQFDRIAKYASTKTDTDPDWSQTLRFHVKKGMRPIPDLAIEDLGEMNMGDGKVLGDFVAWAIAHFPADHYMLVIWDHGQGWRLPSNALPGDSETNRSVGTSQTDSQEPTIAAGTPVPRSTDGAPYRSASNDETDKDLLYNSEIHEYLVSALGGRQLDVLGFDACLMSMIETAYAFRDIAQYMVASEELEPGQGWNYREWLRQVKSSNQQDGESIARITVKAYKEEYGAQNPNTTLSAINLSHIDSLVSALDALSAELIGLLPTHLNQIRAARSSVKEYAPRYSFYHIDLIKFTEAVIDTVDNPALLTAAGEVKQKAGNAVVENYAGHNRQGSYGSNGLAIYYPKSRSVYLRDRYAQKGYNKDNYYYPVAFVQEHLWADFLHRYWRLVPY